MGASLISFLNGNIFGYLLHALEIALSQGMMGIYLKHRRHFHLRSIIAFCLFMSLSLGFGLLFERIFPYSRFLISFLLSLVFFPVCYDVDFWDELFCCVAAVAIQNLSYSLSGFIVGALGWNPVEVHLLYSSIQFLIYIAVHVISFLLCARKLKNMDGGFGHERLPMVLLSLMLTIIIYVIQHDHQSLESTDFLLWRIMFICYDIMSLFMLFGMYDRSKLRRENAVLDQLRISEEQQYEFDKHAIESVNIKCHDLKHQIIALRAMEGEAQERALEDVEKAVMIYDSVAKTGCKPLDVILTNKYLICEQYGIEFTYMIDGEKLSFMSAVDIYSLFGNAIDNAIRAAKDVKDPEERIINLTVTAKEKILSIHVENYTEESPSFKDGLPLTTQTDTDKHGFGMLSMKRIAGHYGGIMGAECSNHLFSLDFTIPIK